MFSIPKITISQISLASACQFASGFVKKNKLATVALLTLGTLGALYKTGALREYRVKSFEAQAWDLGKEKLPVAVVWRGFFFSGDPISSLGNMGGKSAVESLERLSNSTFLDTRLEVVYALRKAGGDKANEILLKMAKDPDLSVRRLIAEILGKIGGEDAVKALRILAKDFSVYVMEEAKESLGDLGE
jgi:hypothetical protein